MARPTKSIDQRLADAQLAINNSLNSPEISAAVTPFCSDLIALQTANGLYEQCMELVAIQKDEYGEQHEATAVLQALWDSANRTYMDTRKISRIALRDRPKAQAALGLGAKPKRSIGGWMEQTDTFYSNMLRNPDFIAAMAPYGYDQLKLEAEAALMQEVVAANGVQEDERGDAQEATKTRDAKLDELDQWLADYKVIARIALQDTPQQLEKLGWVVPS